MFRSISSTPDKENEDKLGKFEKFVLARILVSEAQVERVFSRHKSTHTKMRSNLANELVEKILYVRYNGPLCKVEPTIDRDFEIVDENKFEDLELDNDSI